MPGTALGSKAGPAPLNVASEHMGNGAPTESGNWDRAVEPGFFVFRHDVGRGAVNIRRTDAVPLELLGRQRQPDTRHWWTESDACVLQLQYGMAQRHSRPSSKYRQAWLGSWWARPPQPRVRFDGSAAKPMEGQRAWTVSACCRNSTERTAFEATEARPSQLDFTASSDGEKKRQDVRCRFSSAREHDFASERWPSHAHGKQWGANGLHAGAEALQRLLQSKGAAVASSFFSQSTAPTPGLKRSISARPRGNLWT